MRVNEVRSFTNVIKFYISLDQDSLYIINNPMYEYRQLLINKKNSNSICIDLPGLYELALLKDNLLASCINPDRTYWIDNNLVQEKDYILFLPGLANNSFYYSFAEYQSKQGFCEIDRVTGAVARFWELPFGINGIVGFIDEQRFFSADSNTITLNQLADGKEIWRLRSDDLLGRPNAKIFAGRVIASLQCLLFSVSDSEGLSSTFSVNAETGEILQQYRDIQGYLHKFGEKIYATNGFSGLSELDTNTDRVSHYDFSTSLSDEDLTINHAKYVVKDNLLFFVDGAVMAKNRFGIIDMKEDKLLSSIHMYNIEEVETSINQIDVHGNNIYIHTSQNTLHVFEYSFL